jgi:hypothetical protein
MRKSEVGKSESPKDSLKSKAGSPKPEVKPIAERRKQKAYPKSGPDSYRDESPNWEEENNSAPDSYRDDIPQSEIENPTSEIETQPTANSKLQTEQMEVHHHPEVEKKGLKEYILEGLMIFLAVFMGFMAESLREHIGDRDREKSYMESLITDLKLDTAVLSRAAELKETRMLSIDSVLKYFRSNTNANKVPASTFRQMRRSQWDMFFIHHSGTIDQLKNSGGLRLIREKSIVDSIEHYYQRVQRSESRNTMYFDNQQVSDALSEKLWDAYDNIKYYQDYVFAHKPIPDSGWVAINAAYRNEYLNNLVRVKWITYSDRVQFTVELKNNAAHLIALIKKTYELE